MVLDTLLALENIVGKADNTGKQHNALYPFKVCIHQPFSEHSFLYLEIFKCNTTSDWLNHTVQPIKSCVTFKFTNHDERQRMFLGMVGECGPSCSKSRIDASVMKLKLKLVAKTVAHDLKPGGH